VIEGGGVVAYFFFPATTLNYKNKQAFSNCNMSLKICKSDSLPTAEIFFCFLNK